MRSHGYQHRHSKQVTLAGPALKLHILTDCMTRHRPRGADPENVVGTQEREKRLRNTFPNTP